MKRLSFKTQKAHYDRLYKSYDLDFNMKDQWQWCLSIFPKFDLALEAGCRVGKAIKIAKEMGLKIMGIDFADARHLWKELGIDNLCSIADIRDIPYADNTFDYVFSLKILQHLPADDVDLALGEIHRVGSKLFLLTVDLHGWFDPYWWIDKMGKVGFDIQIAQTHGDQLHVEAQK